MDTPTRTTPPRPARALPRHVCGGAGVALFVIAGLGYAIALGRHTLPSGHPWSLISLSCCGVSLCTGAFQRKPGWPYGLVALAALASAVPWFVTVAT